MVVVQVVKMVITKNGASVKNAVVNLIQDVVFVLQANVMTANTAMLG